MSHGSSDMTPRFIKDLLLVELPHHVRDDGALTIIEGGSHVPFAIARAFTVRAPANSVRGAHAHKQCAQFMTCPLGAVEVLCDDGLDQKPVLLDRPNVGLLVPPTIWARETFHHAESILNVICDRPYETDDYIHSYDEFSAWRESIAKRFYGGAS